MLLWPPPTHTAGHLGWEGSLVYFSQNRAGGALSLSPDREAIC